MLAFIAIGVPFTAAAIVGHGVTMAIEHVAAAKYLGGSAMRPVARAMHGMTHQISRLVRSNSQQNTLEKRMTAGALLQPPTSKPLIYHESISTECNEPLPQSNGAIPTSLI